LKMWIAADDINVYIRDVVGASIALDRGSAEDSEIATFRDFARFDRLVKCGSRPSEILGLFSDREDFGFVPILVLNGFFRRGDDYRTKSKVYKLSGVGLNGRRVNCVKSRFINSFDIH